MLSRVSKRRIASGMQRNLRHASTKGRKMWYFQGVAVTCTDTNRVNNFAKVRASYGENFSFFFLHEERQNFRLLATLLSSLQNSRDSSFVRSFERNESHSWNCEITRLKCGEHSQRGSLHEQKWKFQGRENDIIRSQWRFAVSCDINRN